MPKKLEHRKTSFKGMFSSMRMREHKEAKRIMEEINNNNKTGYVTIHYSCESFYNKPGLLPRITSIAVCDLDTWQTHSFSLHIAAAILDIQAHEIKARYDEAEAYMLREYFDFLSASNRVKFVHWNMRNGNYGFEAIENRGKILCHDAVYRLPDERKIDLAHQMIKKYGKKYISHPQLQSLIEKNYKLPRNFLSGEDEANAFDNAEFAKLHESTAVKAAQLSKLITLAANGELKTNATWKDIYGFSIEGLLNAFGEKWYGKLVFGLCWAAIGAVLSKIFG